MIVRAQAGAWARGSAKVHIKGMVKSEEEILSMVTIICLGLFGCAEVTKPTPTSHEVEAVQLTALTRHPHVTYTRERAMRVFLRLLPTLPRTHGRTYPFLGFNWWVTEAGHPVVDNVWYPSPAHDRPLKGNAATLFDPGMTGPPDRTRNRLCSRATSSWR